MNIFLHTLPNVSQLLESTIIKEYIPRRSISDLKRDLYALPVQMEGLSYIRNPSTIVNFEFNSSVSVTSSFIHKII